MLEGYSRAAALTAPKVAARTPGLTVEGYWVDRHRFFFLAERFDAALGRVITVPSIANAEASCTAEVMPLDALADLLAVDVEALSYAEFDMPSPDMLAVSVGGRDYLVDHEHRRVAKAAASSGTSALYSPDGRYRCFVKDYDLHVSDRETGADRPLTTGGSQHHRYGQRSETCLAAVSYRQNPHPMGLWSPDSQWLLTHRIEERSLPELALVQHAPPGGGRPMLHRYKYSMPGDPLPVATYVAIHVSSGRTVTFDSFPAPVVSAYTPFSHTAWFGKPHEAWLLCFDRYFKRVDLIRLDLADGAGRIILSGLAAAGYVDLHPMLGLTPNVRTLVGSEEIIWYSERDGWGHLYLYDSSSGVLKNRITSGAWLVRDIVHVDEARRKLWFLASGIDPTADPARRSLCSINLDGSGFERVFAHEGDIYVPVTAPGGLGQGRPFRPSNTQPGVSPDGHCAVVRYASIDRGNRTEITDVHTRQEFTIASGLPSTGTEEPLRHFTALAVDGVTRLHGVMFLPSDFDEHARYSLIDYIYPGPQVTHQPQSFRSMHSALARSLAELGFVTIMLDTSRMAIGSRAAQQVGYGTLLDPQLADHCTVVRQLCAYHRFIDADRVGMLGQSGGGFATARALFDYGDLFKVGVAVCGNHDSSLYTSIWSDKFRGAGDSQTWVDQASTSAAHKLEGKLLLISGEMDENVHVSHTLSLTDALVRANKDFDLLIVPNEGHTVLMGSGYVQRRVWDYFVQHLLGKAPPRNFALTFAPHELARASINSMRESL